MKIWLTIVIIIIISLGGIITIPILITSYQSQLKILGQGKDLLQYTPTMILILSKIISWFRGSALEIGKITNQPSSYSSPGANKRQAFVLKVKRKWGKDRPRKCQGRLELEGTNIDNYTIWSNHKRHTDIGNDDDLSLFEILDSEMIFHLNETDELEMSKQ
jgi:hypothetical protein